MQYFVWFVDENRKKTGSDRNGQSVAGQGANDPLRRADGDAARHRSGAHGQPLLHQIRHGGDIQREDAPGHERRRDLLADFGGAGVRPAESARRRAGRAGRLPAQFLRTARQPRQ